MAHEAEQAEARALEVLRRGPHWVPRAHVRPRWMDGERFWYRVVTGVEAHRFLAVCPDRGERVDAFDHDALATALTAVLGEAADPDRLPLSDVTWHKGSFHFVAGQRHCQLDADTGVFTVLRPVDRELRPAGRAPEATRRTGPRTRMEVANASTGPVRLVWCAFDGQGHLYATIAVGRSHQQDTYAGHSWMVLDDRDRIVAAFEASAGRAKVVVDGTNAVSDADATRLLPRSPDGRWQPFVDAHDLWVTDLETSRTSRLTEDGTASDPYGGPVSWSPDGTRLAAYRILTPSPLGQLHRIDARPEDGGEPRHHAQVYPRAGDPLPLVRPRLFAVPEGRQLPVDDSLWPDAVVLDGVRWWPDSRGFVVRYHHRGHQLVRLLEVARDGGVRTLVEERSETFLPLYDKAFWRMLAASGQLLRASEHTGYNHLALHDADGALVRQVTEGPWVVRKVLRVHEDTRTVWFLASGLHQGEDLYHVHLAKVSLDGGPPVVLTEPGATHTVHLSRSLRYVVVTRSRVDLPPVTELRRGTDGSLVSVLEQAETEALKRAGWIAPERFCAPGRDGTTPIYGVIHRPSTFDPNARYPVVEQVYAGPTGSFAPTHFAAGGEAAALAELGFVVVQIDGMGTCHRSKAFHDVCWQNLADAGFPDRIAWLRAAAQAYPQLDLSRVGIFGGSAGGQTALRALIDFPEVYRAAAADCGCHDNRVDKARWNERWMGWPVGPHYEEQSNVTQAHRMEGALLLTVGLMDDNVDPANTWRVVDALVAADKDFELIALPRAGHGAGRHPYVRKRRWAFFRRHLGPPSVAVPRATGEVT